MVSRIDYSLTSLDELLKEIAFNNANCTKKIRIPTLQLQELLSYLNQVNKDIENFKIDASQQISRVNLNSRFSIISTKKVEDLLKDVSFINNFTDLKEKDAEYTFHDFMRECNKAFIEEMRYRRRIPRTTPMDDIVANLLGNYLLFDTD